MTISLVGAEPLSGASANQTEPLDASGFDQNRLRIGVLSPPAAQPIPVASNAADTA